MKAQLACHSASPAAALRRRLHWPSQKLVPCISARASSGMRHSGTSTDTDEEPGFIYVPEAPGAQRRVLMPEHSAGHVAPGGGNEDMVMARAGMLGVGDQEEESEEEGIHIFPEAPGVVISDRGAPDALSSYDDGAGFYYEVGKLGVEGAQGGNLSSYEDFMAAVSPGNRGQMQGRRGTYTQFESMDGMVGNYEFIGTCSLGGEESGGSDGLGQEATGPQAAAYGEPTIEGRHAAGEGAGVQDLE